MNQEVNVGGSAEAGTATRMRRSDQALLLAQFAAGVALAWGLAELWLGSSGPLIGAVVLTIAVHVLAWRRRGAIRGIWLTALGLCAVLSRVDPDLSSRNLGDLRLPVIVGGSLAALAYGVFVEERARFKVFAP